MKPMTLYRRLFEVTLMVVVMASMHCATIINGTNQAVSVNSEPMRASVVINRSNWHGSPVFEGTTPANCRLSRSNAYDVVVTMPGYREETIHIDKTFSFVFLGNLLLGGVPGMIVDLITGAYNDLKPTSINVSLRQAANDTGDPMWYAVVRTSDGRTGSRSVCLPLEKL
jgi:hypothetical protein